MQIINPDSVFDLDNNNNNQNVSINQNDQNNNLHLSKDKEDLVEKLFVEIKGEIENGIEIMIKCKWLIITPSCLFMTLLSWEIVGDEEGWDKSYWILLMGIGMMIILWLLDYLKLMNLFLIK